MHQTSENKRVMKQVLSMVIVCLAFMMLGSCATPQERAARAAEQAAKVKIALMEKKYKINVDRMYPMKGGSKSVSFGYSVEVRNDSLISYLPYFGRAYNIPYGGGKGLNFSAPISSYQESQQKNGQRVIEIGLSNSEDTYIYTLKVFDNGNSSIDVQPRKRERISYSGEMTFN